MTVKDCYEAMGGDYDEIMSRLMSSERVEKFLAMFLQDPSYAELKEKMEEHNYDEAFRASHTLKGVCQNLALTELFQASYQITEALREKNEQEAEELLGKVTDSYEKTVTAIHTLLDKNEQ